MLKVIINVACLYLSKKYTRVQEDIILTYYNLHVICVAQYSPSALDLMAYWVIQKQQVNE